MEFFSLDELCAKEPCVTSCIDPHMDQSFPTTSNICLKNILLSFVPLSHISLFFTNFFHSHFWDISFAMYTWPLLSMTIWLHIHGQLPSTYICHLTYTWYMTFCYQMTFNLIHKFFPTKKKPPSSPSLPFLPWFVHFTSNNVLWFDIATPSCHELPQSLHHLCMEHTALCLMEHSWDLIVQSLTTFTWTLSLTHVAQPWTLIVTHVSHDPEQILMDT